MEIEQYYGIIKENSILEDGKLTIQVKAKRMDGVMIILMESTYFLDNSKKTKEMAMVL
jgi:hypothetical protein